MSIYTISDLHLSLGNKSKSMEVFKGWEGYVEKLKTNWENTVRPEDTVVIIGDISWAMKLEESQKDLDFIDKLPGKKLFIKGNHDFWWSTTAKVNKFIQDNHFDSIHLIYNSGFEVEDICVCGTRGWMFKAQTSQDVKIINREVGRLRRSIEEAESKNLTPYVFLHYPPIYGNEIFEEILNILIEKKVKKCYYGHIHGNGARKVIEGEYKNIELKLVSCDYVNFCPVLVK